MLCLLLLPTQPSALCGVGVGVGVGVGAFAHLVDGGDQPREEARRHFGAVHLSQSALKNQNTLNPVF